MTYLFNPHTRHGAAIVDGMAVSEFTAFVPAWVARRLPRVLGGRRDRVGGVGPGARDGGRVDRP